MKSTECAHLRRFRSRDKELDGAGSAHLHGNDLLIRHYMALKASEVLNLSATLSIITGVDLTARNEGSLDRARALKKAFNRGMPGLWQTLVKAQGKFKNSHGGKLDEYF